MPQEQSWTQFNGNGPEGLWDPNKVTQDFQGSLITIGGHVDHTPLDTDNPMMDSATGDVLSGIQFQGKHLGEGML